MANSRSRALGLLALALQGEAPACDGELLTAFLERRDSGAFAALMERHGPMVFGVCQRILQHRQDAEDAFQATFVVLARKAASISPRNAVGNWLYGVAFQTALRQRSLNAKRLTREALASKSELICADPSWDDLSLVLDEELSRVPSHYRAVLVLCDVEGRTQVEAARHLGCPEGTVSSRLCRARAFLAKKLTSRGISLTTAAVVMLLDQHATATIPACLLQATAASALTGKATAAVATLSQGVLNAMVVQKIKLGTVMILMCGLLGLGGLGSVQALWPIPATEPQSRKEPARILSTSAADPEATRPGLSPELKAPFRLEADAKPIDTETGHASPLLVDFYGTGKLDLLVGAGGRLQIYKNTGTNQKPRYAAGVTFMEGQPLGSVPGSTSTGFGPQFVDLDGDGIKDMVSGSSSGEIYLFRGKGAGQYADREMIVGKDGYPLNLGGGVEVTESGHFTVTGQADIKENIDGSAVITHRGKSYKVADSSQIGYKGTASSVAVADWNGDGLLDLIVGTKEQVGVYLNTGATKKPEFDKAVVLKAPNERVIPIVPMHGYAGVCVADWDGDGRLDLLVGAADGSVTFYRNLGTTQNATLAAPVILVPQYKHFHDGTIPTKPMPGTHVKICVADWNGDGMPDLILGDWSSLKATPKQYSRAEAQKIAEAKALMDSLKKEYPQKLARIDGSEFIADLKERKAANAEFENLVKLMIELEKIIPSDHEDHGWVWVFERKAMAGKVSAEKGS